MPQKCHSFTVSGSTCTGSLKSGPSRLMSGKHRPCLSLPSAMATAFSDFQPPTPTKQDSNSGLELTSASRGSARRVEGSSQVVQNRSFSDLRQVNRETAMMSRL